MENPLQYTNLPEEEKKKLTGLAKQTAKALNLKLEDVLNSMFGALKPNS